MLSRLALAVFGCLVAYAVLGCGDDDDKSVNPPGPATVTGTLTLPEAAAGKPFAVLIDQDCDGDNGCAAMATGSCSGSTQLEYTITDVPAGNYYVYAVVWAAGNPDNEPLAGDFLGFYGGGPTPPAAANFTVPSEGTVQCDFALSVIEGALSPATVSGTITLPSATEGSPYFVVIDTDYDVGGGVVDSISGYCGAEASLDFEFTEIPEGDYYVFSVVWVNGDPSADVPQIGDYVGFYPSGTVPAESPNVTVPESGVVDCDFALTEWPGSTVPGTLHLPYEADGKQYIVVVDDDEDGDNGVVAYVTGSCGSGTTVSYSIPAVQEGEYYYLYAVVWVVGEVTQYPIAGDFEGYYGSGATRPEDKNFIIWPFNEDTFDITLFVVGE